MYMLNSSLLVNQKEMERISKPHLVDLLRIFDKRRWLHPRILYASVRSKPELIADLARFFYVYIREEMVHFKVRGEVATSLSHLPVISYNCEKRQYLFASHPFDVPAESRKKPSFSISHGPVTVTFPRW